MIEASSQLQTIHEMSAVECAHQAARQVSRWNLSSSCSVTAEGFRGAGETIIASNRNRLACKIEADRCNQRTNINASDTGVRRSADFGNYTLRAGRYSGQCKREVSWGDMRVQRDRPPNNFATEVEVTFGTPGARKAAECPPGICRPGKTQNKIPKHDRICSPLGH